MPRPVHRLATALVALVLLALTAGHAHAQNLACEKYTLPNGMTVILHEDHSLPVASINIWYRVGAQDEPPGRSGFAHLFEHLMFMGTKRVPGGDFDSLMEAGGGANNASTDLHRTNYYSWGPSSLLPTLLWLDADRLEDMGLQMTQEKLDKQRDVVRNELRQRVENEPYGKADEAVFKLMYEPSHPYYYGVIGTHEDLEAANVTNVKDFFANFYVPSNASLVVAGDFNPEEIRPLVAKLFGTLPGGQKVVRKYTKPTETIPVRLKEVKRFTAIDNVQLPKVQFTYHSPAGYGPGDAEMDLLGAILADGTSSRLYQRLVVKEKLAADVEAAQHSYPLGSLFQINVLTTPEADLDRVEKILDEELAALIKKGPTRAELAQAQSTAELGLVAGLQRIEQRADKLNMYEYQFGDPNSLERDLARYRDATTLGVKSWARQVLTPDARLVVRVLPQEPARASSPRDERPPAAAARPFSPPAPTSFALSNGLNVLLWERHDLPLVATHLMIRPGGALDDPAHAGRADLAVEMLTEGAGSRSAEQFAQALQSLGAKVMPKSDRETLGLSMVVLRRNLEPAADLFADAILRPRLAAEDWERVQRLRIDDLKREQSELPAIAARVGSRLLYGDSHPFAWPAEGTVPTVSKLSHADITAAVSELVRPQTATLLIAGDLTAEQAKALFEPRLGVWTNTAAAPAVREVPTAAAAAQGMRVAIIDQPGSTQTMVRFVGPGVTFTDQRRVGLELINTILGGSFTSRLNQNLREKHGYTYGAGSSYGMGVSAGSFAARSSVQGQVTGPAVKEFLGELDRLAKGDITDAEVVKARETLRNERVRDLAGLEGVLRVGAKLTASQLPFETLAADLEAAQKADAAQLNSLAAGAAPTAQGVLVLVGDKATILEQIKDLNLPKPVEYTVEGEPKDSESAEK